MNSFLVSLLLASTLFGTTLSGPGGPGGKRDHPTKLAHFNAGILVTASGKLRVNVDKELGGPVSVQLLNPEGQKFFDRTLYADEDMIRLSLDLSHLATNTYTLKVSNGLEMITREIKIDAAQPVVQTRSVTMQ